MHLIIVNGTQMDPGKNLLTFAEILGFAKQPSTATVTYHKALGDRTGTMRPGDLVHTQEGTVFNVVVTSGA